MYAADDLKRWSEHVLVACGLPANDARDCAEVLVRTNLHGVDSHGISRLPAYVAMLRAGEMSIAPQVQVTERAGTLVVDADYALGQVAGPRALRLAIERAATQAVVTVVLRNIGHLGALGAIITPAAEQGCLALLMQNGPPMMGMPGSHAPGIGNNPLAFAAPTGHGAPFVFDMAASEVAFGKIIDAARSRQPLPAGWALNERGEPTTDAAEALRGMLLPTGGFKGVGLAMMVELLAGSLSGVLLDRLAPGKTLPRGFGAFLMVINPHLMIGKDAFAAHRDAWIQRYKASASGISYPGERSARVAQERGLKGIPLPPAVVAQLSEFGQGLGVPFPRAP